MADFQRNPDPALSALPLLTLSVFSSLLSMRLCDAMLPALADHFETGTAEAATVISAHAVVAGLMQLAFGMLGDRHRKLLLIAWGATWCTLTTVIAAAAPSLATLVVARAAVGGGAAGMVLLTLAWIGDNVPFERRQAMLARYTGAAVSGTIVGTWAGGFVTQMISWRAALLLPAPLFAIVALLIAGYARREVGAVVHSPQPYCNQIHDLLALPWARRVFLASALEGALAYGFLTLVPSVLHHEFSLPLSQAGGVLALVGVGGLVYSLTASALIRRMSLAAMAYFGSTLLVLGFALLALMPHWSWAIAGCALAGFGYYSFHSTLQVNATQLSHTSRGVAVSMFGCSVLIGQSAGVALAAYTFGKLPPSTGYGVAALALGLLGLTVARQLRARQYAAIAPGI